MTKSKALPRVTDDALERASKAVRAGVMRRKVKEIAISILTFGIVRPKPVIIDVVRGIDRNIYKIAEPDRMSFVRSLIVIAIGVLWFCLAISAAVWVVHFIATGKPW